MQAINTNGNVVDDYDWCQSVMTIMMWWLNKHKGDMVTYAPLYKAVFIM